MLRCREFLIHAVTKECIPKVNNLNLLKIKSWKKLGLQLGIELCELNKIEEEYRSDSHTCMVEMISRWLMDIQGPTYSKLITALVDINERMAAEEVSNNIGECYEPYLMYNFTFSVIIAN